VRRNIIAISRNIPAQKAPPRSVAQKPRSLKNEKINATNIMGNVIMSGMILSLISRKNISIPAIVRREY